nr:mothers against decapentaplegic homolog 6-like [Dermatophagoides farinae]
MLPNIKYKLINRLLKKITSIQHDHHQNHQQQQRQQQQNRLMNENDIFQYQQRPNDWLNNITDLFAGICGRNSGSSSSNSSNGQTKQTSSSMQNIRQYFQLLHRKDLELLIKIIENENINNCIIPCDISHHHHHQIYEIIYWMIENIHNVKLMNQNDVVNDYDHQTIIIPLPWCRMYNSHNNNNPHHHISNSTLSSSLSSSSSSPSSSLCLNPYHWAVLIPRPDYQQYYDGDQITFDDQLQLIDNDNNHEIINFDKRINSFGCCETISILSSSPECDLSLNNPQRQRTKKWARISYWEFKERKITDINARNSIVFIGYNTTTADNDESMESISLSSLLSSTITNNNNNEEQQIKQERRMNHTRMRIGNGIALFHDSQQNVWIYNRSKTCSIFIESPLYSKSSSKSKMMNVVKVLPGHSIKAYDYQLSQQIQHYRSSSLQTTRKDIDSFRFSFVKGFGVNYKLNDITNCPCWMEVILFL